MPIRLRVVCWNIAEGSHDGSGQANSALSALAEQIRARSPDIVLLNEARVDRGWPFGSGVNQFQAICNLTGLAYYSYGATVATGWTGWKCVGVLSRYPILSKRVIPVMRGTSATTYATCEVTVEIAGLIHHVFATRFDAHHPADREAGMRQAVALIQAIDTHEPVIFGGDFNAGPNAGHADFDSFERDSGLTSAFAELPDPGFGDLDHIDHIFYRGPYRVTRMEQRCVIGVSNPPGERGCAVGDASDHPSVFVELTTPPGDSMVIYGGTIRLKHLATVGLLHSHLHNYGHPGSSGQQQVTAFGGADGNDLWRLKGPHGSPEGYRASQPILHGEVIRLEHVATGRNLHSHAAIPSPVTGQQEVTCFGQNGIGDWNDDWRVEVDGGGPWTLDKRVKLIHVPTNHALHSHAGFSHPQWTMGQQEVTCFSGRDDNDWWYLTEVQLPLIPPTPPRILTVGVQPHPVPINRALTVTVTATDSSTGSIVAGQVEIDGRVVANTNTPFSYTFTPRRRRVGTRRPPEWEVTYPVGVVVAAGYTDASIDFGFPEV